MNKIAVILILSGSLFVVGCSRPATEATAVATPTPQSQSEQRVKAKAVEIKKLNVQPKADQPITTISPSASASATP